MNLSYQLTYLDNSTYTGQSLSNDWDNAPNKPIKKLVYCFNKKNYVFEGYKEYIHLKENVVSLNGKKGITQIVIIGRKEFESHLLIINFLKKKVYREVMPIGEEYNNLILNGWKKGI